MFKENIKQFFGYSWKSVLAKIILGFILFVAVTFIHAVTWPVVDYWASGWPFHFSESWGPCPPGGVCHSNNTLALISDIVLWYFVLCLATYLFRKMRGRKGFTNQV
jgi:hypothetical protein